MIEIIRMKHEQKELDVWLIVSVFVLLAMGLSMVYSASLSKSLAIYSDRYYIVRSQVFWILIGALFFGVAANFPHRHYMTVSRWLMLGSIALMLLVFVPGLSHQVGKAKRWIRLGFLVFQPSEIAKLALVVYLADFLSRRQDRLAEFRQAFLPGLIVTAVLVALALAQSNLGTAVILLCIAFFLFFVGGIPLRQMLLVFLSCLPVLAFMIIREPYRIKRMTAYLNPWAYPDTAGYNIIQSWKSFYNGGLLGVGWGQSIQKTGLLPAPHTDFIMAVLGEEMGLVGVVLLSGLFMVVLLRGCSIGLRSRGSFSRLLALGITAMILLQAAVNMGVVTGILPTTGLVLPFVSYGGSSLVMNMSAIGILVNIHKTNVLSEGGPA